MRKRSCMPALLVLALCVRPVFSDTLPENQWVLAAQEFSFTQGPERSSAETGLASLIPQLILEQISSGSARLTSRQEMLDRRLSALLTERISLFLQLSRQIKARDSLVLSYPDSRKLKAALRDENKKISDIQKKIDDNLKASERARKEFQEAEDGTGSAYGHGGRDDSGRRSAEEILAGLFSGQREREIEMQRNERVTLYKDDFSRLFEPGEEQALQGLGSREFESAVVSAGIQGLITGQLTVYGDYVSVTASLSVFPGSDTVGTITEVGSVSDAVSIAHSIARYMIPKITNSRPVHLRFDVVPVECRRTASLTVDGILYQSVPDDLVIDAGIHTVELMCPGYMTQAITYNFADMPEFLVHIPLEVERSAVVSVSLRNPAAGSLYANGLFLGDIAPGVPGGYVSVNGAPVIGQFISAGKTDAGPLSAFFYVPSVLQEEGGNLMISVRPQDNASVIDKRRIWMYRGYTALVLSVPVTLFTTGRYVSAYNSYALYGPSGSQAQELYNQSQFWSGARIASIGITAAAGAFFAVELIRYLHAASSVLPAKARTAKPGQFESAVERTYAMEFPEEENPPETGDGPEHADTDLSGGNSDEGSLMPPADQ